MKRRDLIRRLGEGAEASGVAFELLREGAEHTVYSYAGARVAIPRHREINERTAQSILKAVGLK